MIMSDTLVFDSFSHDVMRYMSSSNDAYFSAKDGPDFSISPSVVRDYVQIIPFMCPGASEAEQRQ